MDIVQLRFFWIFCVFFYWSGWYFNCTVLWMHRSTAVWMHTKKICKWNLIPFGQFSLYIPGIVIRTYGHNKTEQNLIWFPFFSILLMQNFVFFWPKSSNIRILTERVLIIKETLYMKRKSAEEKLSSVSHQLKFGLFLKRKKKRLLSYMNRFANINDYFSSSKKIALFEWFLL